MVFEPRSSLASALIRRDEFFHHFAKYCPPHVGYNFPINTAHSLGYSSNRLVHNHEFDFASVVDPEFVQANPSLWDNPSITEDFLLRFFSLIPWDRISENPGVRVSFLRRHRHQVNWDKVLPRLEYDEYLQHQMFFDCGVFYRYGALIMSVLYVLSWVTLVPLKNILLTIFDLQSKFGLYAAILAILILDVVLIFTATSTVFRTYREFLKSYLKMRKIPQSVLVWIVKFVELSGEEFYRIGMNPRTSFSFCISLLGNYTMRNVNDLLTSMLIRKFFADGHTQEELFQHPFFVDLKQRIEQKELTVKLCKYLPRHFLETFVPENKEMGILSRVKDLDERFWHTHWHQLGMITLCSFLRDWPMLTLNFIVEIFPQLVVRMQLLHRCDARKAHELIIRDLAYNPFTYQRKLEKYDHLFCYAKRHFLHRYYNPQTELGERRLSRDYAECTGNSE